MRDCKRTEREFAKTASEARMAARELQKRFEQQGTVEPKSTEDAEQPQEHCAWIDGETQMRDERMLKVG